MRIVSGIYGGRRLEVPSSYDIRPTSDKVRGAIFNALVSRGAVDGARVLDCFCGTGALGLEALSRGAVHATFWDKDRRSLDLAKRNVEVLGAMERCDFVLRDACGVQARVLGAVQGDVYDLVFLDPPYRKGLVELAVQGLQESAYIRTGSVCVVEAEREFVFDGGKAFDVLSEKIYGDTKVLILECV